MQETRHTAATGIFIAQVNAYNVTENKNVSVWGHFTHDRAAPAHVGPWYKTKAELLADHDQYLTRAGWVPGF